MYQVLKTWMFLLMLCAVTAPAYAQRPIPSPSDPRLFVETVDDGALGAFQLIRLDAVKTYCNPYTGAVAEADKASDDFMIYDPASGSTLIVRNDINPLDPLTILEAFQWTTLRPNMVWESVDLDGDGRSDLIGHDRRTGQIIRQYQRGRGC